LDKITTSFIGKSKVELEGKNKGAILSINNKDKIEKVIKNMNKNLFLSII